MKVCSLLLVLLLSGCGAIKSLSDPSGTSFFLISKGGSSAFSGAIAGDVTYCKVTQGNLSETDFTVDVEFDGENCNVKASAITAQ